VGQDSDWYDGRRNDVENDLSFTVTFSEPTSKFSELNMSTVTHNKGEFEETHDQLPLISREGLRKKRSSMSMKDRMRKNRTQVSYLTRVYQLTGGKLDRRQRKRAM